MQSINTNNINMDFIERYQKLYEKDPQSKVFAPLGEAYRKIGLVQEALDVLNQGVKLHPHFVSGRVALAKLQIEQNQHAQALEHLKAATELSPENLLAQKLLAECYLILKRTKEALKAYKMILFINPNDAQAQNHVKKLESLTADEYEDDVFEMKPLRSEIATKKSTPQAPITPSGSAIVRERQLERILSLTDAFIARLDLERALETLTTSEAQIGKHPEIDKRKKFIFSRQEEAMSLAGAGRSFSAKNDENELSKDQRIDFLKNLLQKIESRRQN